MKKKFIGIAVLITVMAGSVFAQSIPGVINVDSSNSNINVFDILGSGFESPQSQATQGLFTSAADDFITPTAYTDVGLKKWYGMASFADTSIATLGYATKFGGGGGEEGEGGGGLYLGLFYSGSFWANVKAFNYSEGTTSWLGSTKNVRSYTSAPTFTATDPSPYNQIAILIGVADMGFRLSFITTHQIFTINDDTLLGTTPYKTYKDEHGIISPQLAWGMAKDLTEKGIRPYFTFDLHFFRDYQISEQYVQSGGNYVVSEPSVGRSNNAVAPEFNLGLGGFTLAEKDGWATSLDLTAGLLIVGFDNEYNYTDSNSKKDIKKIKGIGGSGTSLAEISASLFSIAPSLGTEWIGEKLSLKANLDLNFGFSGLDMNPMEVKNNAGDLQKDGTTAKAAGFAFNPDLQLAAQWQLASKLFVNAGGRINLNAVTVITTEGKIYNDGNEVANSDYKSVATTYGDTENHFTLGVTLNPITNLSIEATTGLAVSNKTSNNMNVFSTGNEGLFNFASILVSLKF